MTVLFVDDQPKETITAIPGLEGSYEMPTLNEYFDKIICINIARRTDRWEHVLDECGKHELAIERFDGIDLIRDGNRGCTESHGAVLRLIIENGWRRTLILEDDFEFRFEESQELFADFIGQVPGDWWMLYLGGHYGNFLNRTISENVIRFGHMKTTSSYAVTLEAATEMAPFIKGIGPIDELYLQWHQSKPCYIFTPRLCVQYMSFSDLQMGITCHRACMEDTLHEDMLDPEKRIKHIKTGDQILPRPTYHVPSKGGTHVTVAY